MQTILPELYLKRWKLHNCDKSRLQEIRLRVEQPLILTYEGLEVEREDIVIKPQDLTYILEWLCGYGIYAYQEEMSKGYIAVGGGHRVGIGGQVVCDASGQVVQIKYVSSLLIRVSHNVTGIAEKYLDKLYQNGCILNTLVLAPPGSGKTTFLRDLVRLVSDGNAYGKGENVSLIDEREELAGLYMGIPSIPVGKRTDIISGCEKGTAMEMCLRALAPQVVAVDEIYSEKDLLAIKRLKGCGCGILATHHALSMEDFLGKAFGKEVEQSHLFERYVLLGKEAGKYIVRDIVQGNSVQ